MPNPWVRALTGCSPALDCVYITTMVLKLWFLAQYNVLAINFYYIQSNIVENTIIWLSEGLGNFLVARTGVHIWEKPKTSHLLLCDIASTIKSIKLWETFDHDTFPDDWVLKNILSFCLLLEYRFTVTPLQTNFFLLILTRQILHLFLKLPGMLLTVLTIDTSSWCGC